MERNQYVGLYASDYKQSKIKAADILLDRKMIKEIEASRKERVKEIKYQEYDNIAGKDTNLNQVLPHIQNINLSVSGRQHWKPEGVFGVPTHYLPESTFIKNENDLTTFCSKYREISPPNLTTGGTHNIDEFIKKEVSTQETYNVNYKHKHYNEMKGVPDFTRYPLRPVLFKPSQDTHATSERIVSGHYKTIRSPQFACPFAKLIPRDNLYAKMNGLPRQTKEEMAATERKNKAYVSSNDFLPNSFLRSPKRSEHSNSYKT